MKSATKSMSVQLAAVAVPVSAGVLVILLLLAPEPGAGLCSAGVAGWLALAVLVPLWMRRRGSLQTLLFAATLVVASLLTAFACPAGRLLAAGNLALHAYLLCFAIALMGIFQLASALFRRRLAGQAAATIAALLFAFNVILVSAIVERYPKIRNGVIAVTLSTNPVSACGAALGYDVMRKAGMYEACAIGSYRFQYPLWYAVSGLHLIPGLVLLMKKRV